MIQVIKMNNKIVQSPTRYVSFCVHETSTYAQCSHCSSRHLCDCLLHKSPHQTNHPHKAYCNHPAQSCPHSLDLFHCHRLFGTEVNTHHHDGSDVTHNIGRHLLHLRTESYCKPSHSSQSSNFHRVGLVRATEFEYPQNL